MKEDEDKLAFIERETLSFVKNEIKMLEKEEHKDLAMEKIHAINRCMLLITRTKIVSRVELASLESSVDLAKETARKKYGIRYPNPTKD